MASAVSTVGLKAASKWSLAKGLPRNSQMRLIRRPSPHQTMNAGAVPIQGMPGISAAISARSAGSAMRTTEACWRSDLALAEKAQANSRSSMSSGTGRSA